MAIFLIRFSFQQHHQQHSTKQQYQFELYTLPSLSSSICHRPTVHYVKCPLRIFLSCYVLVVVMILCISCYYYTILYWTLLTFDVYSSAFFLAYCLCSRLIPCPLLAPPLLTSSFHRSTAYFFLILGIPFFCLLIEQ